MATAQVVRSERFPDLADEVLFPRLSDAKLVWLAKRGTRRRFEPGEVLYEHAERDAPFYVVERGLVEFIDRKPGKDVYVAQADGRTYIGDIAAFTGEPTISACVAVEPTDVIVFGRGGLRAMVARWPEFGEQVFATLLARRAWHEAEGHGIMRLIAPGNSRRAFEVRDLLERNLLPVRWYDADTDSESAGMLEWLDIPRSETPVLIYATEVMRNPSAARVARSLRLRADVDGERFDLVVLGAGPAGLAASVYGGSEGLRTLVAEAWAPGGQAGTSTRIENYLGFPTGIRGTDLTRAATLQARRFGAVLSSFHRAVELADGPDGLLRVDLDDGQYVLARSVVIATGARPWDSLTADEQRLFCRMAEVYAGFMAHADHQIGRLLDYLEETEQRENTLILLISDNGASGEGGPDGSVNENNIANGIPDSMEQNLAMLDELGGTKTYNHYPNGWAMAFNTPFKMWKRYEFNGGTSDPCIISWPKGMEAKGEIREQYHHAIDLVPTILDCLGVEPPETIGGHVQSDFDGVSMRYSFDHGTLPTARATQFYSMLGSRAIWHDGWKAVTTHPTISGWSHFGHDTWELYHTDVDRSELHNLADREPERLNEMISLWYAEAGRNGAFPLDDRSGIEILTTPRPLLSPARNRYVYYPDLAEVPESQAVNVRNRSYGIGALVDIPAPGAEGVLFAHGSRFGGHALYINNNRLHYDYNWVGHFDQKIVGSEDVPVGDKLILAANFEKDGEDPPGVATGILSLYHGEKKVGEARIKTQPGKFSIAGEGLCVGRDSSEPVTSDYPGPHPHEFTGGTINRVAVDVSGEPYIDLEREAAAMLARE